jgi:DNA-binding winged helix-turn-helix (wHTH) protein
VSDIDKVPASKVQRGRERGKKKTCTERERDRERQRERTQTAEQNQQKKQAEREAEVLVLFLTGHPKQVVEKQEDATGTWSKEVVKHSLPVGAG